MSILPVSLTEVKQVSKISDNKSTETKVGVSADKNNGNKLLYASLSALALLAVGGGIVYKIKKGGKANTNTDNALADGEKAIEAIFKKGKAYDKDGNLYSGITAQTSSNGHCLLTNYVDGVVSKRIFIPKDGYFEKLEKTYDRTIPGTIGIRSAKTMNDGSVQYSFFADFTEKKFSPEIEGKIKMSEFDALTMTKEFKGKKADKDGLIDLGDGVVLKYTEGEISLLKNGVAIRKNESILLNLHTITNQVNGVSITRLDKKFLSIDYNDVYYKKDGCKLVFKDNIIEEYDPLGNLEQLY